MSDRIVVMNGGRVQQIGTPQDLYRTPANLFVASFIGAGQFPRGAARARRPRVRHALRARIACARAAPEARSL